jgi:hypothetical protein
MTEKPSRTVRQPGATALWIALGLALALGTGPAAAAPTLWGYGVKSCGDYLAASPAQGAPAAIVGPEYARYREWLAGLVTGLNLATGTDVLAGAELDAALTRIRAHCKDRPADDFFNASMSFIRALGQVRGKGKKD